MVVVLVSCAKASTDTHDTRFMMGTLVSFTVVGVEEEDAERAIQEAANEMQRVEHIFTIYGSGDNAVKQFNRTPPHTVVALDAELDALLQLSVQIQQQSHGAFNPALGALNLLWGFSQEPAPVKPPSEQKIDDIIGGIKGCLHHSEKGWWRDSNVCQLDFGGIAKGYAIDRGIMVLKQHGIQNAMINAGGDMRLIGKHGDQPWRIGIRHPRDEKKMLGVLALQGDVSVVTSGDYERFFWDKEVRYHHILDATTGYPSQQSQSVTVVAENATLADGWSTAMFVMGEKKVANLSPHAIQFLRVNSAGQSFHSQGWSALVQP